MASRLGLPGRSKILVTGDRHYTRWPVIENALRDCLEEFGDVIIIHGAYGITTSKPFKSADALAEYLCREMGILTWPYPAPWEHGRHAGMERNQRMADENPDIVRVLAFHDNLANSKGTLGMVKISLEKGFPVWIYENGRVRKIDQLEFDYNAK